MLNGRGVVPGRVPDVLDWVVVGRVRRRMDRCDAFQRPGRAVRPVNAFRVVGSERCQDDAILPASASCWAGRCEGRLPGVDSARSGMARLFCWSGRAPEKDWDVLCRSTDGLVLSSFGGCMRGSRPCARGGPRLPCRIPWSNRVLTWVVTSASGQDGLDSSGRGRVPPRS